MLLLRQALQSQPVRLANRDVDWFDILNVRRIRQYLPARTEADSGHLAREHLRYTEGMTEMTTIKVSVQTRDRLNRLADEEHLTMDGALSRVPDKTDDARFWVGVRADYARLQPIQRNGRITSAN